MPRCVPANLFYDLTWRTKARHVRACKLDRRSATGHIPDYLTPRTAHICYRRDPFYICVTHYGQVIAINLRIVIESPAIAIAYMKDHFISSLYRIIADAVAFRESGNFRRATRKYLLRTKHRVRGCAGNIRFRACYALR